MKKYMPAIGSHNLRAASCHCPGGLSNIVRIPVALSIIEIVMSLNVHLDAALRSTSRFNKRVRLIYLASEVGVAVINGIVRCCKMRAIVRLLPTSSTSSTTSVVTLCAVQKVTLVCKKVWKTQGYVEGCRTVVVVGCFGGNQIY